MPLPVLRMDVLEAAAEPTAERARTSCRADCNCADSCCGLLATNSRPWLLTAACQRSSAVLGSAPVGFRLVGHCAVPLSSDCRNVSPCAVTVPVNPSAIAIVERFCQNAGLAELGVTMFGIAGCRSRYQKYIAMSASDIDSLLTKRRLFGLPRLF